MSGCSVAQSCPTLCDPVDRSTPGFPVLPNLPEFAQTLSIESVMPSNHLLCRPLLLLPSIFPGIRVLSDEWGNPQTTDSLDPQPHPTSSFSVVDGGPTLCLISCLGPSGAGSQSVPLHQSVSERRDPQAEGTSTRVGARPSSLCFAPMPPPRKPALQAGGWMLCQLRVALPGSQDLAPTTAGCLPTRASTCQRSLLSTRSSSSLMAGEGCFRVRTIPSGTQKAVAWKIPWTEEPGRHSP